ncbi:MAG: rhodanese-like domain-containing protein [Anaerolineales bacterium]|nr:rhodanese-like domain-containing protein [Anaerolineales bacterium]
MSKHRKKKTAAGRSKSVRAKRTTNNLPVWVWVAIGLAILVVTAGVFLWQQGTPAAQTDLEISVEQAYEYYQEGAFLLDVRQPEEWEEYHIPNTTWIPLGELSSRLDEVPQDQKIVVVCRTGNRSQEGREILLDAGWKDVLSMEGGVSNWRAAGYPVTNGQ